MKNQHIISLDNGITVHREPGARFEFVVVYRFEFEIAAFTSERRAVKYARKFGK